MKLSQMELIIPLVGIVAMLFPCTLAQAEDGLPECIILDPKDLGTYLKWKDCGDGRKSFAALEYNLDIMEEPYSEDALYTFGNLESGSFCMETDLATTISSEVYFEVVVLVKSVSHETELLLTYLDGQELNLSDVVNEWVKLDGEIGYIGEYKIRITAEIKEGDLILIESLILTDLNSEMEECRIFDEEIPGTTTEGENTEDPDEYLTTEDPDEYSTTEDSDEYSTTEDPDGMYTTEPSPDGETSPGDQTSPSDGTAEPSWSTSPPPTEEPTDLTPSPSEPSPTTTAGPSVPPPVDAEPNDTREVVWMAIAIVFIGLFGVLSIFMIYKFYLPTRKVPTGKMIPASSSVEAGSYAPPAQPAKLPRLQVDHIRGETIIRARHH